LGENVISGDIGNGPIPLEEVLSWVICDITTSTGTGVTVEIYGDIHRAHVLRPQKATVL
jgi:hypothetical protein